MVFVFFVTCSDAQGFYVIPDVVSTNTPTAVLLADVHVHARPIWLAQFRLVGGKR